MAILRTIICDACGASATEPSPNDGWIGWGGLNGVQINDVINHQLCPACLAKVAEFVDKEVFNGVD